MPRNGSGVFSYSAGSTATTGATATASTHNIPLADILEDANAARPVVAGGTGSTTASGARTNLGLGTAAVADILGTVSESGGTPTGDIVERGSNANGEYVRFADGTMICTKTLTGQGPISTAAGSVYASSEITIGSTPSTFSAAPTISFAANGATGGLSAWCAGSNTVSTTSFGRVFLFRASSTAVSDFNVTVTAVGRWF